MKRKNLISTFFITSVIILSLFSAKAYADPPVADAGDDQTASIGDLVILDGTGSYPTTGTIRSYQWEQTDTSGYTVTINNASSATASFTVPSGASGEILTFQLTVTNNNDETDSDSCDVYINIPPVSDAGDDQTVSEGDTVTLSGSGTDIDGTIATYAWTQTDTTGYDVSLTDNGDGTASFTAPEAGASDVILQFQLTVTDNDGATGSDSCTVTVSGENDAPTADAGTDQIISEGDTVTLSGSGTDIDGTIVTYAWTQTDSSGYMVAINNANSAIASFTAPEVGTSGVILTFQLIVTDNDGETDSDSCDVYINIPPVSDAGDDQTVSEGDTVTLSGSGTDIDGTIATYAWTQTDTTGYDVSLTDNGDGTASFTAPEAGASDVILQFQLTVTDNDGATGSDSCTVTVSGENDAPTADAGTDQTISEGDAVTLTGSGTDIDGTIVTYAWTQTDSSGYMVAINNANSAIASFTAPEVGASDVILQFQLTVTDNEGATGSDSCTVTVSGENDPPVANDDATYTDEDTAVTIDVLDNDTDPDPGDTLTVQSVTQPSNGTVVNNGTNVTYSPNADFFGDDTFTYIATDGTNTGNSATVTVIVTPVNDAPVAEAGDDQTVDEEVPVTLTGSGTDVDGDDTIASYAWVQTDSSGYDITLTDNGDGTASFTAPDVEESNIILQFQLTVADNDGAIGSDTCNVTVTGENDYPVADAGDDQTVEEGVLVTLDGFGSTDSDDGIESYLWEQIGEPSVDLSDEKAASPTFTAPNVLDSVDLTFRLTVTDTGGQENTDVCIVTVTGDNDQPNADAGPDQNVDENITLTVTLDGSNSSDPDYGDSITCAWVQTDDTGYSITLDDPTAASPTFATPNVDQNGAALTFELTVTDTGDNTSTDTCIVNVTWFNMAPIANAGPDQEIVEQTSVTLNGSGSSDEDDGIASYLWEQIDKNGYSVILDDPAAPSPTFTTPNVGPDGAGLIFRLTVTDSGGLQDTDECVVNVTWDNIPPVADAGDDQDVEENVLVTLDGSGSYDIDDSIVSYLWSVTAGPSVTISDATSIRPAFNSPNVGPDGASITFQLIVTDTGSLTGTDTCIVNVSGENDPPVAIAGADQVVEGGATITLEGSRSYDSDDGIASYLWEQLTGTPVDLSDTIVVSPTFTAPDAGSDGLVLSFQLTVTDTGGLQGTDTCVISIIGEDTISGGGSVSGCFIATVAHGKFVDLHLLISDFVYKLTNMGGLK